MVINPCCSVRQIGKPVFGGGYKKPGKPVAGTIKANSLNLSWEKPDAFVAGDTYQVRYKNLEARSEWKFIPNEYTSTTVTLTNLKANTKFIFQVRMIDDSEEGPYSESSNEVFTDDSPGTRLQKLSRLVEEGTPSKYALPLTENRDAFCERARSRKFELDSPPIVMKKEKTIMFIGATDTGRKIFLDGLVNYILGVNRNDPFRFTTINLEDEEKQRTSIQASSQQDSVMCYTINPEQGNTLDYRLNIIDIPGLGDTRGLRPDEEIVDQIRELFSAKNEKGVAFLDAVCIVIKASDAKLTATQRNLFNAIMSIFGRDLENNICSIITFADGKEPPVIAALKEENFLPGRFFTFNNSCLFSSNTELNSYSHPQVFWDIDVKSYQAFFDNLSLMGTKSLSLTKQVLEERLKNERLIAKAQSLFDTDVSYACKLKQQLTIIQKLQADIEHNNKVEYTEQLLLEEHLLSILYNSVEQVKSSFETIMVEVNESNNRLKEIALQSNHLSVVEHLDSFIEVENKEQQTGFQGRIKSLIKFKKKVEMQKT